MANKIHSKFIEVYAETLAAEFKRGRVAVPAFKMVHVRDALKAQHQKSSNKYTIYYWKTYGLKCVKLLRLWAFQKNV